MSSCGLARGDRRGEAVDLRAHLIELAGQRARAQLELGPRFFQPAHVGLERAGALDQGGVHGAGFGGAAVQVVGRLPRVRLTALRRRQPLVGQPLVVFQPADRFPRFDLPAIERVALFFGLTALADELVPLLGQARRFVRRVLQLRVVADDRLLLPVLFGVQRGDAVRRLRDRGLETSGLLREAGQGIAVFADALAQLLDLALGLQDAARFFAAPAADHVRAAKHIAGPGRDRSRGEPARNGGLVVAVGNPGIADGRADRVGEEAGDAHDGRKGHGAAGGDRRAPDQVGLSAVPSVVRLKPASG